MLTKKDFIKAAEWIAKEFSDTTWESKEQAQQCANLIIYMNDNPNFDKKRFLKACGLEN